MLCLCMLVRDARELLPDALEALEPLKGVLSQYVFVDTGSEDATVSYLQNRLPEAKVLEAPWQDHFSQARNLAFAEVETNWVLWLDADERFSYASALRLKQFLLSQKSADSIPLQSLDGLVIRRENLNLQGQVISWDYLTRLIHLPSSSDSSTHIEFAGRVHERLVKVGPNAVTALQVAPLGGVTLRHLADPADKEVQKLDYYLSLMQREREVYPSPYLDYHWAITPVVQAQVPIDVRLDVLTYALADTLNAASLTELPDKHWAGVPVEACFLEIQYLLIESGQSTEMLRFFEQSQAAQVEGSPALFAESWGNTALAYLEHQYFQQAYQAFYESLNPIHLACDPSQGWSSWRPRTFLASLYSHQDLPAAHVIAAQAALLSPQVNFKQGLDALVAQLNQKLVLPEALQDLRSAFQKALEALDTEAVLSIGALLLSVELQATVLNATLQALICLRQHTLAKRLKHVEYTVWGSSHDPVIYRFEKTPAETQLTPRISLLWQAFSPQHVHCSDWVIWCKDTALNPREHPIVGEAICEITSWPACRWDVFCFEKGEILLFSSEALKHKSNSLEAIAWNIVNGEGADLSLCPYL